MNDSSCRIDWRTLLDEMEHRAVVALDKRVNDHIIFEAKRLDQRMDYIAAESRQANSTAKEAVVKAETTMNSRLEGMNEFRDQLNRQAATFISITVFDLWKERVQKLERVPWLLGGLWGLLGAVIGGVIVAAMMKAFT